jgi:hypothetical protein
MTVTWRTQRAKSPETYSSNCSRDCCDSNHLITHCPDRPCLWYPTVPLVDQIMPSVLLERKKKDNSSTAQPETNAYSSGNTKYDIRQSSSTTAMSSSSSSSLISFATNLWTSWSSRQDFIKAQLHVAVILGVALIGNNWPYSYPRNDNENATMFWVMNAAIAVAAVATVKHDPHGSARGVQLLSREQTEEWKGWMQWAFIMVRKVLLLLLSFCAWHERRIVHSLYIVAYLLLLLLLPVACCLLLSI